MNAKRPTLPLTGGCPCGAIRYEITSFPLLLYACNCTDCQRQTGSAFALSMPVRSKDFHIVQGMPKPWSRPSPTGAKITSWFCSGCSGRIRGEREGRAEITNVRAGTLDDTSWLVPVGQMFMRSAQPWVLPAAAAACYETGAEDFKPLTEAWRRMWPDFFPGK